LIASGGQERERPIRFVTTGLKNVLLQGQYGVETCKLTGEKLLDAAEAKAQPLQGEHLVQSRLLIGPVGAPTRFRSVRLDKPDTLVNAERLGADA
jgi:hypothetical protein